MKKLQRFLCAVLCIVMIAAMAVPMSASALITSAAPTTAANYASVEDILKGFDKDAYTVVEFGNGGKPSLAEYQAGSGVKAEHTVYDGVNATKLVTQDIAWASFAKSHIAFANNVTEFKNYGYMVVKYASESDNAYKLSVGGWGESEGVAFDVPKGKTGWTTSEALAVSAACAAVSTSKRSITSTSSTAETYIGNIVFFKNQADAEEYAKWAPYLLDPNGEAALRKIQQREENWPTIKLIMSIIGSAFRERVSQKPVSVTKPDPFENLNGDEYSIISFCEGGNFDMRSLDDSEYVASYANYNGEDCVKFVTHPVSWAGQSKANFSFFIRNYNNSDFNYMVITYASESDNPYWIGAVWSNPSPERIIDVPAGVTDWTLSDIIPVTDAFADRTTHYHKSAFVSSSPTADTYIKEVVFFENESAAKEYVRAWNEYYEGELNPEPSRLDECEGGYTLHTLIEKNFGYGRYGYDTNTHSVLPEYTTYNGVECIKPGYNTCWANVKGTAGGYGVALANLYEDIVANRKYGVITYASAAEHQLVFNITWARDGVIGSYPDVDGWMSTCFEIDPGSLMRETNRHNTGVYSTEPFYLRELVFFETEEDAEAYAAKAPAYYNGEEFDEDLVSPVHPANMRATEIYARISTSEHRIPTEGGAYHALDANAANEQKNLNEHVYFNDYVEYLSGFGKPASWASVGAKKGVGIRLYNLPKVIDATDDAYMVAIIRSESASSQNIGMKPVAYNDNVNLGTIPANTKGWVATTPININGIKDTNGTKLYDKLIVGGSDTFGREFGLYTNATDTDSFDVCEIVFFTSEAAAIEYSAKAEKYYNDLACLNPLENLKQNGEGEIYITTFAKQNASWTANIDYTSDADGNLTYGDAVHNDVACMKFGYGVNRTNGAGTYCHISWTVPTGYKNVFTSDAPYQYAVATYATNTESKAYLQLHTWSPTTSTVTLTDDISVSDGRWITSGIVKVEMPLADTCSAGKMMFVSNLTDDEPIYVREIAFFSEYEDAVAYVELAPEYFNGEEINDPAYWLDVLGHGYSTTFTKMGTDWNYYGNYKVNTVNGVEELALGDTTYKGVPCAWFAYGTTDKGGWPISKSYLGYKDVPGYGAVLANSSYYKYAVVTYATEVTSDRFLKIQTWGALGSGVLADNIKVSNGNWVTSEIIESTDKWATADGNKMIFFSNLDQGEPPIYISEIRFFANREAAQYYKDNAPAYYNSFNN